MAFPRRKTDPSKIKKMAIATKKRNFEIRLAPLATLVKPRKPAISEIIKNNIAHLIMPSCPFRCSKSR